MDIKSMAFIFVVIVVLIAGAIPIISSVATGTSTNILNTILFLNSGTDYTEYSSGLKLWYNFDNISAIGDTATQFTDISRNANHGTVINGSPYYVSGRYNSSLFFDNATQVQSTTALGITPTSDKTLAFWLKANTTQGVLATWGNEDDALIVGIESGIIIIYNNATNLAGASFTLVNDNAWHYLVLSYNSTAGVLDYYLDGTINTMITANFEPTDTKLSLGKANFPVAILSNQYFLGRMDEVRVWDRALSANQVALDYRTNVAKTGTSSYGFVNSTNTCNIVVS